MSENLINMFVNYTSIYCLKDQFIGTCISELGTSDVKSVSHRVQPEKQNHYTHKRDLLQESDLTQLWKLVKQSL